MESKQKCIDTPHYIIYVYTHQKMYLLNRKNEMY